MCRRACTVVVFEKKIRRETKVSKNRIGFTPGEQTTGPVIFMMQTVEKYGENKIKLCTVFVGNVNNKSSEGISLM